MPAAPYITPKRFALGGFGIDTTGITAPAMRATLRRASTMVNTWCNGSQVPQPFDFRGGTVTNEQHLWPLPDILVQFPGSRRVFVNQRPLRTVTAFEIQFTNNYRITLDTATDLFVNATESWMEIVASQPTIIGYPPIGVWYGLYTPVCRVTYTYGYRQVVTDDECEAATPKLYYATYGMWDSTASIEVQIDGVVVDPANYSTNADDGSITFDTAPSPGTEVTAAYTTTLPDAISQATGLIAVDLLGQSRIAARGMVGIESMKVAEVAITQMKGTSDDYVVKNGVRIPAQAAAFLGSFALGSAA